MALTFPVLVGRVDGTYRAETPALPGWAGHAAEINDVLGQAKLAIEEALNHELEATGVAVGSQNGYQLHTVTVDEPTGWWDKDPTE